ncbi:hypothetical protein ACLTEW_05260 [Gordonia lacunae]|uniref:hypothetical protein n=1 Tax=Gordonia lacunae TaxID=417102 RepID=UPI0039E6B291
MGEAEYRDAGRAQALMLLVELERHARFLVSRIEQSGRRSRDITGEVAELNETYETIAALRSHYGLVRSPANTTVVGRTDARARHRPPRGSVR